MGHATYRGENPDETIPPVPAGKPTPAGPARNARYSDCVQRLDYAASIVHPCEHSFGLLGRRGYFGEVSAFQIRAEWTTTYLQFTLGGADIGVGREVRKNHMVPLEPTYTVARIYKKMVLTLPSGCSAWFW